MEIHIRLGRRLSATALATATAFSFAAALLASTVGATFAHSPDPLLGTTPWGQDQVVNYAWASGQVPPSWLATAIDAGAADSTASRASHAAIFVRASSAPSRIAYGGSTPCPSYGIACMDRTGVPTSFAGMWFRPHGTLYDWGVLKWCQAMTTIQNGCYDARRVALDEFGHIQMLGHHVNYADESDYLDAIVQYAGRSRAKEGWDAHAYGRCDIARLQLEYELLDATTPVSTCLSLSTALTIAASSTYVSFSAPTVVSGDLWIASSTAAKRLSGDPLSSRVVVLQRRDVGATAWVTIGAMGAVAVSDGSYALTIKPLATADYRLSYTAPSTEGLRDSTSTVLRITVGVLCDGAAGKGQIAPNVACL